MRRRQVRDLSGKGGITGRPLLLVLLVALAGCAGVPERPADWSPVDMLPDSCRVIIAIRVEGNEDLVFAVGERTSGGELVRDGLERTERLFIGLEGFHREAALYVVGSGSYPSGVAKTGLYLSSDWRKQRGTYPWYLNTASGLKVSFPESRLFCVTNGDINPMLEALAAGERRLPESVKASLLAGDITVSIPRFEIDLIRPFIAGISAFPAENLFLRLLRHDDGYLMDLVMEGSDEKSAQVLGGVLKFLLLARARKGEGQSITEFMKSVVVEAEGTKVRASGILLKDRELLDLIGKITPQKKEG